MCYDPHGYSTNSCPKKRMDFSGAACRSGYTQRSLGYEAKSFLLRRWQMVILAPVRPSMVAHARSASRCNYRHCWRAWSSNAPRAPGSSCWLPLFPGEFRTRGTATPRIGATNSCIPHHDTVFVSHYLRMQLNCILGIFDVSVRCFRQALGKTGSGIQMWTPRMVSGCWCCNTKPSCTSNTNITVDAAELGLL